MIIREGWRCEHTEARGHAPMCPECARKAEELWFEAEAPRRAERAWFVATKLQELLDKGHGLSKAVLELLERGWIK